MLGAGPVVVVFVACVQIFYDKFQNKSISVGGIFVFRVTLCV